MAGDLRLGKKRLTLVPSAGLCTTVVWASWGEEVGNTLPCRDGMDEGETNTEYQHIPRWHTISFAQTKHNSYSTEMWTIKVRSWRPSVNLFPLCEANKRILVSEMHKKQPRTQLNTTSPAKTTTEEEGSVVTVCVEGVMMRSCHLKDFSFQYKI